MARQGPVRDVEDMMRSIHQMLQGSWSGPWCCNVQTQLCPMPGRLSSGGGGQLMLGAVRAVRAIIGTGRSYPHSGGTGEG